MIDPHQWDVNKGIFCNLLFTCGNWSSKWLVDNSIRDEFGDKWLANDNCSPVKSKQESLYSPFNFKIRNVMQNLPIVD